MVKEMHMCLWNPLPFHCPPGLASSFLKGPDITHLSISSGVRSFHCKPDMLLAFKLRFLFGLSNLCNLCVVVRDSFMKTHFFILWIGNEH